ncbi:four helix bundle protein [Bacteroides ovatus]|uniref:four helix bundle protein n=1 Tax=Bacteroides koreensis TaxID=1912896 RepID=UPI00233E59B6|nr:four helix bundle protein [Bacteroides ovatus]MDC2648962.1 four helix bundle protein [Bacteroides ovatus]
MYQKSCYLATRVNKVTRTGEFKFDTRFVQQVRASSGSVSDNIAEGFERQGNKEFINFLYIAKGSCGELRSQVNRAHNVGFIDDDAFNQMFVDCKKLPAGILNMINVLKKAEVKGSRYANPSTPSNSSNK